MLQSDISDCCQPFQEWTSVSRFKVKVHDPEVPERVGEESLFSLDLILTETSELKHRWTVDPPQRCGHIRSLSEVPTCSLKSSRRTFMHSSTTSLSSISATAETASPDMMDISTACFPCLVKHTEEFEHSESLQGLDRSTFKDKNALKCCIQNTGK